MSRNRTYGRRPRPARQRAVGAGRGRRLCALPRRLRLGRGDVPAVHRADRVDGADRRARGTGCWRSGSTAARCAAATSWSSRTRPGATMPMVKRVVGVGGDKVACCDEAGPAAPSTASRSRSRICRRRARPRSTTVHGHRCPRGSSSCSATTAAARWTPGSTRPTRDSGSVPRSAVQARVDAIAWPMNGMLRAARRLRRAPRRGVRARAAAAGQLGCRRGRRGPRSSAARVRSDRRAGPQRADGAPVQDRSGGRPVPTEAARRSPGWSCSTPTTASCCCTATNRTTRRATWWFTPGGGLEGDESREQAALPRAGRGDRDHRGRAGPGAVAADLLLPVRRAALGPGRVVLPGTYDADGHRHRRADRAGAAQRRRAAVVDLPRNCPRRMRRCIRPDSPSCCARCSTKVPRDALILTLEIV